MLSVKRAVTLLQTRKNFEHHVRESCSIGCRGIIDAAEISASNTPTAAIKYYYTKHLFILLDGYQRYFSSSFPSLTYELVSLSSDRKYRECASGRVLFIPHVFDRSSISNAVYNFCPVTSHVLDKNRLLGLEIGGNFNARTNRPHAWNSSHV